MMRVVNSLTLFYGEDDFLSNWYRCRFEVRGVRFNCAEQYLMYAEAKLFKDEAAASEILATDHPRAQKVIGRRVKNFNEAIWHTRAEAIMTAGLYEKFRQNPPLESMLIATMGTELVEASASDTIWGAGLALTDNDILDKTKWRGENRLGNCLMSVRHRIYHGITFVERVRSSQEVRAFTGAFSDGQIRTIRDLSQ